MKNYKLELPNNFMEVKENEMELIEGGKCRVVSTKMSINKNLIAQPLNALSWWYGGKSFNAIVNKVSGVVAGVIGSQALSGNISSVIGAFASGGVNLGTHLANKLDRMDGKADGRITYIKTSTVC